MTEEGERDGRGKERRMGKTSGRGSNCSKVLRDRCPWGGKETEGRDGNGKKERGGHPNV